ncbi:MAG TPA: HD domain-containing phosphohydrolase, partial [Pyrinomonadaceae bacterium]|nr:HD domain-containing phosphohydrolase [Pyrinomonadaceae bacterium]
FSERPMTDLKVVQDWLESGSQVQSALSPFTLERDGHLSAMLGSYATVELDRNALLGVIAIQDESAALASVGDMRNQVFFVSLVAATLALLAGFYFADKLTRPVRELAAGARRIAGGDFSQRVKVVGRTELGELGSSFNQMTDQIENYVQDLQRSAEANHELFIGTVKALAAAIDGKDPYTRGHSERVSRFSIATAEGLGLPADEVEKIRISALLHDVGKIGIDDRILKKPAALDDQEFEIMKTHPQKGYKIMSQIPAMREFLPGMYMHHEMVNGQGYPQGLKGDAIPMQARIVSVADTFDAMTTERPYQAAMDLEAALTRLKSFIGTRYDARVVAAFIAACEAGRIRPGVTRVKRNLSDWSVNAPQPITSTTQDSVLAVS